MHLAPLRRTRRIALAVAMLMMIPFAAANADDTAVEDSRVVVAVIDSGANPYHEFFDVEESSVTQAVLDEFEIGEDQIIDITRTGDFFDDYEADRAQFAAIERGKPYWFRGTNVIGISFRGQQPNHLRPDGDASAHGIGTMSSVLNANPEAIVVAVEGINRDAEEWAMNHPAVDAITTSYGPPGSPPLGSHLSNSYDGVVNNGKLHFGAVDNSPALSPFDSTGGPWWSIGVSGYEEGDTEGRQVVSGSLPDVVGDFTQTLPYCRSCVTGMSTVSGTSFATPTSAGVVSKVLLEARRAAGHVGGIIATDDGENLMVEGNGFAISNWELRRALEDAAAIPGTDEYTPGAGGIFGFTSVPVLPVASYTQIGWGLVTEDEDRGVVAEMLARLEVGDDAPTRVKSDETCSFMTANIEARIAYWNNLALFSDGLGEDAEGYIFC